MSLLATIHTHQDGLKGKWGNIAPPGIDDNKYFPYKTPNIPYLTIAYDMNLYARIGTATNTQKIDLPKGYSKVNDLLLGASLQLILRNNK